MFANKAKRSGDMAGIRVENNMENNNISYDSNEDEDELEENSNAVIARINLKKYKPHSVVPFSNLTATMATAVDIETVKILFAENMFKQSTFQLHLSNSTLHANNGQGHAAASACTSSLSSTMNEEEEEKNSILSCNECDDGFVPLQIREDNNLKIKTQKNMLDYFYSRKVIPIHEDFSRPPVDMMHVQPDEHKCLTCQKPVSKEELMMANACSFCAKNTCASCHCVCDMCKQQFCSLCSMKDYQLAYDRHLCLECNSYFS